MKPDEIRVVNIIELPPSPCSVCGEPMLIREEVAGHVMYYRPGGLPATTMYHTKCDPR